MSHVDTVLELGPGLNVITGPNNCGKSAIVAAIQLVCRNHLTADVVVRHGARECSVTIWTDDDHEITWRRKGKDVSYTIDGTDYGRLRGNVPEILHGILKLPEIEEGDENFDLHFGLQKEPIFLLDEAGSKAAKFFASSSDAARLMEMQSLHKKRNAERKGNIKLLLEQSTELELQLEQLAPVVELRQSCDASMAQYRKLTQLQGEIQELQDRLDERSALHSQWLLDSKQLQLLTKTPDWPQFLDTDPLEEWLVEYKETIELQQYLRQRKRILEQLIEPPVLKSTEGFSSLIANLESLESNKRQMTRRTEYLEKLAPPPEYVVTSLPHVIHELRKAREQHQRNEMQLIQFDHALRDVQVEIQQWIANHPECPVCHRTWDVQQALHSEAHQHV